MKTLRLKATPKKKGLPPYQMWVVCWSLYMDANIIIL